MSIERDEKREQGYQQALIQWKSMNVELNNPHFAGMIEDHIKKTNRMYLFLAICTFILGLMFMFLPPMGLALWAITFGFVWVIRSRKKTTVYSLARYREDLEAGAFN